MCANNLREGAFDSYAVDPNNPQSTEDGFFIVNWVDPSDPALLLPAVRPISLGDRSSESALPMEQIKYAALDHGFELMA